jgi:hypothetical protein
MTSVLAVIVAILEIIAYIIKSRPSQTKQEVIREIWARRKESRDVAIVNNKDDLVSIATDDIVGTLNGLPKKDPDSSPK